ncbi:C2 domain protein, putative (macronuclear) [Tetrahymena thermophila SB210]|uniref:C2 domain protein, putative n=1 Tax=Tetrahymena thermophila (strain SB210) TaxID=312017 RepID=I7MLU1_TETTS|nr:C2 domain protein, putative [Tetrahymena thermophila SB210]EAS03066.3 C2 domain protein, putative [Tetrahymena thermophila SB210]|eukprot:XP_001023311.3 C2 domain protein, putative [Tetrahymena thermophila SB210]
MQNILVQDYIVQNNFNLFSLVNGYKLQLKHSYSFQYILYVFQHLYLLNQTICKQVSHISQFKNIKIIHQNIVSRLLLIQVIYIKNQFTKWKIGLQQIVFQQYQYNNQRLLQMLLLLQEQSQTQRNKYYQNCKLSIFKQHDYCVIYEYLILKSQQKGEVSYNKARNLTNPIELKLKPIQNSSIEQKLSIILFEDEVENAEQQQIFGQYQVELSYITRSLLNLGTNGYFSLPIQFVNEQQQKVASCWLNLQIKNRNFDFTIEENNQNVVLLPQHDPLFNFAWRLRVDVRQITDLPANTSAYVECNWTMSDNSNYDPNLKEAFYEVYRTQIKDNQTHPLYNTQFLMNNPFYKFGAEPFTTVQGYLAFKIKDSSHKIIDEVFFPLQSLKPFIPLNIELQSVKKEFKVKPKYYLSLTLEQQPKDGQGLCDIIIHNFDLSGNPANDTNLQIMLTNQAYIPKQPTYTNMEIQPAGKISKLLEKAAKPKEMQFLGHVNSIQPIQADQFYGAIAVFTFPVSQINTKINIFALSTDPKIKQTHKLCNTIIGQTEAIVDSVLQKLKTSESIESQKINIKWNKSSKLFDSFSKLTGQLDIGVLSQKDAQNVVPREKTPVPSEPSFHQSQVQLSEKELSQNDQQDEIQKSQQSLKSQSYISQLDKRISLTDRSFKDSDITESQLGEDVIFMNEIEKWKLLSRELAQRQEILHRMNKDIEDKTDSLKQTGEEITDLRKKIKVLKNENDLLMKRLNSEVEIEQKTKLNPELRKMKPELLQQNIIKVATAYRDEKLKNEEFDKQIKEAYSQIIKAKHSQEELEHLLKVRLQGAHKLTDLKDIISKAPMYRETIEKQEKIILKLEQAMETTMKGSEQIKQMEKEFNKLKDECESLQENLRNKVFDKQTSELQRVKRECEKLESINKELLVQLSQKQRPSSTDNIDLYSEQLELEAKLYNISSRVEAFQEELNRNAQEHSKELSQLKTEIAKKQAIINSNQSPYY